MQPEDEGQPGRDQDRRSVSIRLSRDTLLLLGALTFLIIAVGLTFLFPLGQGSNTSGPAASSTPLLQGTASQPTALALDTTSGPYPGPAAQATATSNPVPSPALVSPTSGLLSNTIVSEASPAPYPIPVGSPPAQAQTATTQPPPTFMPTRPTADPAVATFPPAPTSTTGFVAGGLQTSPTTEQPTVASPTTAPTTPPSTPTEQTQPTRAPVAPTPTPNEGKEPEPTEEPTPAPPTALPVDVLRGNVRWSIDQSPIILRRDVQLAPGAMLIIEPGVEVRIDPAVSIYVDGAQFLALGLPERPIRIVANAEGVRWSGLFAQPNSYVVLENTEVRGGGAGGTVVAAERSELVVRRARFSDNGGTILLTDTKLEMRDSEVAGNDLPYNGAIDATYSRSGPSNYVTMTGNRFGGNRLSEGAPMVRIINQSTLDTLNLDIQRNLIRGGIDNLVLSTNGPLQGTVACNALVGGNLGFSLRTQTPQTPASPQLTVANNLIDEHTPPIIPVYIKYGIGRGAASEVPLDMRNNWWGEANGPYHPDSNEDGRGDSVGANITYNPWLSAAPDCVPPQ